MSLSQIKRRRRSFRDWWAKKHHHTPSHHWLTKHARRVLHAYPLPPTLAEDVIYIIKRYNLSEHRRLKQCDAWTLYKVIYPTVTTATERIIDQSEKLEAQIQTLKALKAEAKGKYRKPQAPLRLKKLI